MPNYSYACEKCNETFELFSTIANYQPTAKCPTCKRKCKRDFAADGAPDASVRLADSEIKTVGHLAHRNTEKMSDDEKIELHKKHNEYRYQEPTIPLPKGAKYVPMSERKKPKWY